jgi:hypothetical protein
LNVQSSISAKPAARKTKKTSAIGFSAAAHIWNHVDAVESRGGGGIMWSELVQRQAPISNVAWKYFGAYFCGAGDASLFETDADFLLAWLGGRDLEGL